MFAPTFTPSGPYASRIARKARTCARASSVTCRSSRSSNEATCWIGATIRCPEPYGYRFMTVIVQSVRSSTSASASSVAAMRLQITHPRSSLPRSGSETYSERQSAHSRSSGTRQLLVLDDVGGEALDELIDLDVALRFVAAARIHTDSPLLDVAVAHDEHVRHLLRLRAADACAERARAAVLHVGAEALGAQPVDDTERVGVVAIAHGQHRRLDGREPRGEGAGVVLEQHREESLDRTEQ